jgi:hypothetical protein
VANATSFRVAGPSRPLATCRDSIDSGFRRVGAHNYDLRAAQAERLRTAFVPRPTEYGPGQTTDLRPEGDWDVVGADFLDLATTLGA